MHCHGNRLTDGDLRPEMQQRVEVVLAPYADRIESFGLSKPLNQQMVVEVIYKDKNGPDSLIAIPDEQAPQMEERILSFLRR